MIKSCYLRKLNEQPTKSMRPSITRKNLLPHIQTQLALQPIRFVSQLMICARAVEETNVRVQQFCSPPTNYRQLLEPQLAYRNKPLQVAAMRMDSPVGHACSVDPGSDTRALIYPVTAAAFSLLGRSEPLCWNCRRRGHAFRYCQETSKILCYGCVRENITFVECSSCPKKHVLQPAVSRPSGTPFQSAVCIDKNSIFSERKQILDYVLAHAKDDVRPYLHVKIYGRDFLGLLDSGATRTSVGGPGLQVLGSHCATQWSPSSSCTLANGPTCKVLDHIMLPIKLCGKTKVIEALVAPSLPHAIILGMDFWVRMEIVPDFLSDRWSFRRAQKSDVAESVGALGTLTEEQQQGLNEVIERAFSEMGDGLGCTDLVEHTIKTNSPPIKQRHYPLLPPLQKQVNEDIDQMLESGVVKPSSSPWASPIVN